MRRSEVTLPAVTVEDAEGRITTWLRAELRRKDRPAQERYHLRFALHQVIDVVLRNRLEEIQRADPPTGPGATVFRHDVNDQPFHQAAWDLCRRGILYPVPFYPNGQGLGQIYDHFALTPFGIQWLERVSGYECLPSEHSRFGAMLAGHTPRFGAGFHSRSQEALACYQSHTYLACCVMCGAAAESILLGLAIAKCGDEEGVLREYGRARGRAHLEQLLASQQNSFVQGEIRTFTALLHYWRDEASHGMASEIGEEQAFVALLLLLRFAQFADERWMALTTGPRVANT